MTQDIEIRKLLVQHASDYFGLPLQLEGENAVIPVVTLAAIVLPKMVAGSKAAQQRALPPSTEVEREREVETEDLSTRILRIFEEDSRPKRFEEIRHHLGARTRKEKAALRVTLQDLRAEGRMFLQGKSRGATYHPTHGRGVETDPAETDPAQQKFKVLREQILDILQKGGLRGLRRKEIQEELSLPKTQAGVVMTVLRALMTHNQIVPMYKGRFVFYRRSNLGETQIRTDAPTLLQLMSGGNWIPEAHFVAAWKLTSKERQYLRSCPEVETKGRNPIYLRATFPSP